MDLLVIFREASSTSRVHKASQYEDKDDFISSLRNNISHRLPIGKETDREN